MTRITGLRRVDLHFPIGLSLDGSDAKNPGPNCSDCYVLLETDGSALSGHGLTSPIGRGNEIRVAAWETMRHLIIELERDGVRKERGASGTSSPVIQMRRIGPDKCAIHTTTGASVCARSGVSGVAQSDRLIDDRDGDHRRRCADAGDERGTHGKRAADRHDLAAGVIGGRLLVCMGKPGQVDAIAAPAN